MTNEARQPEFFTTCKSPDESYSTYVVCKEGLHARIDHLTPTTQSRADWYAELTLFAILFGLLYNNHVRQALTTQPDLMLQQASDACICVKTGLKLHLTNTESASAAAGAVNCWKCDSPGHLAASCPHASAIKVSVS